MHFPSHFPWHVSHWLRSVAIWCWVPLMHALKCPPRLVFPRFLASSSFWNNRWRKRSKVHPFWPNPPMCFEEKRHRESRKDELGKSHRVNLKKAWVGIFSDWPVEGHWALSVWTNCIVTDWFYTPTTLWESTMVFQWVTCYTLGLGMAGIQTGQEGCQSLTSWRAGDSRAGRHLLRWVMYWRQLYRVVTSWHSHNVIQSDFKPNPNLNHSANPNS